VTERLEAIVFDFDGVIVNSEPLHLRAYQWLLAEEGVPLTAHEYYSRYVGLSDEAVFAEVLRSHALTRPASWVHAMIRQKTGRIQQMLRESAPLFPQASDRIRALAGVCPLAIASGALRAEIDEVLTRSGLAACFAAIVAANDTRRSKPAPDPYALAVQRLSALAGRQLDRSRIVAIEDTRQGLAAARAAGLRTVGVSTTYPASSLEDAELVLPDISAVVLEPLQQLIDGGRRDA
jgi:beta-phosphoglucomutase